MFRFSSVIPQGHPAQWFSAKSAVSGQGPCVLRPSSGQVGQLFAGHAAHAFAQLPARHAAG